MPTQVLYQFFYHVHSSILSLFLFASLFDFPFCQLFIVFVVGSNPQISLDVSLLSMSSSLAWHVADEVIIRLPSYCEYDILGYPL